RPAADDPAARNVLDHDRHALADHLSAPPSGAAAGPVHRGAVHLDRQLVGASGAGGPRSGDHPAALPRRRWLAHALGDRAPGGEPAGHDRPPPSTGPTRRDVTVAGPTTAPSPFRPRSPGRGGT